jgi:hypothetical protein
MTLAWTIAGVSALTALLGWSFWRMWKTAERAARDPKYLRRRLLFLGGIYLAAVALAIEQVATGQQPIQSLFGLPVGLALAWFWLRSAKRVKVPPEKPQ